MATHEDFLRLFVPHEPGLRVLVASLVRDRSERDDLLQELALVLWREFDRYDPARPFGPWARGVAGKLILRQARQAKRYPLPLSPQLVRSIINSFDRADRRVDERLEALEHCMSGLKDDSRELLSLRYERDLKLEEIALVTASTVQAVHKSLARLRDRLLGCIEKRLAAKQEG